MDTLRFAHHFFHFELAAWTRAAVSDPRQLFHEGLLPRRQLRLPSPATFEDALRRHDELCARERALGIRSLAEMDPDFPEAFRQLPPERRPALIYLRGAPPPQESRLVAIVGTRHPSEPGRDAALSFAAYFSAVGLRVVSGLARGIDTIAHEKSLEL